MKKTNEEKLEELFHNFAIELAELQTSLSIEELQELGPVFQRELLFFIKQNVGEDMLLHYIIDLASMSSKYLIKLNHLEDVSKERARIVKDENTN